MKYKIYTHTENAIIGMLKAINNAHKSIYLEMYILSDLSNYNFFKILKEKAEEGVKVKIIADAFGCLELKRSEIISLKKSGIEFLFFSHWLRRVHRKILIIDEKIAFIGGVNISQKHITINDLQIAISGKLVKSILKSFAYTYNSVGGKDPDVLFYLRKNFFQKARVWFLEHWPKKKTNILRRYYKEKISEAKKKIIIITPYFIPHRWLIMSLESARQRGVEVDVIIPQKSEQFMADNANYLYAHMLQPIGINFFLTKHNHHGKAFLIDDKEGCIGSHNIDALSFDFNTEAGVFFRDKKIIVDLIEVIESWKKDSIIFDDKMYKPKLFDKIIGFIIKFLQPVL